ncbi:uncharacterized protein LOC117652240 [Thrips palmi]|uniref:Uncharacterized protein LOC117652240 n=1 Tax=Thrips palmi TaxID=161013 RepID=A0A6P9A6K3_THRPL|nr:uncharacterized protein LOC117652240 [Thrips palmi]
MASNAHRDMSMDSAKARHLQVIWNKKVKALARQTRFTEDELQALCLVFHKICETYEWWGSGITKDRVDRLDIQGFRDGMSALLDMAGTASLDALYAAQDPNNKRYVTASRWIRALDAVQGSDEDRANLCWRAYLHGEEGGATLTRATMAKYTKNMFIDVGIDDFSGFCKEFVDTILKDTAAGKEGFMTHKQYLNLVAKSPLFTEFLLELLPSRDAMRTFLATLSPPPRPPRGRRA